MDSTSDSYCFEEKGCSDGWVEINVSALTSVEENLGVDILDSKESERIRTFEARNSVRHTLRDCEYDLANYVDQLIDDTDHPVDINGVRSSCDGPFLSSADKLKLVDKISDKIAEVTYLTRCAEFLTQKHAILCELGDYCDGYTHNKNNNDPECLNKILAEIVCVREREKDLEAENRDLEIDIPRWLSDSSHWLSDSSH